MAIRRREQIFIGVSVLLFAAAWTLTSSPPPPQSPTGAAAQGVSSKEGAEQIEKMAAVSDHLQQEVVVEAEDPFAPISKTQVVVDEKEKQASSFKLQGTFSDSKGKAAILNGEIIYEGAEVVPGITLEKVTRSEVILKRMDEEIKVEFEL